MYCISKDMSLTLPLNIAETLGQFKTNLAVIAHTMPLPSLRFEGLQEIS